MLPAPFEEAVECPATQWALLLTRYSMSMNLRKSIAPIHRQHSITFLAILGFEDMLTARVAQDSGLVIGVGPWQQA